MTPGEFFHKLRRASRRSPRYIAGRVVGAGRARFDWVNATVYPWLTTERTLLRDAGAATIDELWQAQQRVPFFVMSAQQMAWAEAFKARYPDGAAPRRVVFWPKALGSAISG